MNLQYLYRDMAERFGDNTAFQMKDGNGVYKKWSFNLVGDKVDTLAAHLISLGVKKGDRVALLSENRPEWPISYLAIVSIGAAVVPLDANQTRRKIEIILKDCCPKAIIMSGRIRKRMEKKLGEVEIQMDEISKLKRLGAVLRPEVKDDDLAAIIYVSASVSPKGVMLSHNNIYSNADAVRLTANEAGPGDNFLSVLPLYHPFETTCGFFCAFLSGSTITFAESLFPNRILENMRETKVNFMMGVPALFRMLYQGIIRDVEEKGGLFSSGFRLLVNAARLVPYRPARKGLFPMVHMAFGGNIKYWVTGGAPIDPKIVEYFWLFGIKLYQGYGLTEASPVLTANVDGKKPRSVGKPLPGVEIKINHDGEILARGPNIMKGYYKRPDLTAEVMEDGWLHTGDVGVLDSDGYLYIVGRIRDKIVTSSGKDIYPEELEHELDKIEGIKETAVLGVVADKGARMGQEEVCAVIIPDMIYFKENNMADREETERRLKEKIFAFNDKLAEYMRIARVVFRYEKFPRSVSGILKGQLKKEII